MPFIKPEDLFFSQKQRNVLQSGTTLSSRTFLHTRHPARAVLYLSTNYPTKSFKTWKCRSIKGSGQAWWNLTIINMDTKVWALLRFKVIFTCMWLRQEWGEMNGKFSWWVRKSKQELSHFQLKLKGYTIVFFSLCYTSPSRVSDKKIDPILSTVCAIIRKRWAELAHRYLA